MLLTRSPNVGNYRETRLIQDQVPFLLIQKKVILMFMILIQSRERKEKFSTINLKRRRTNDDRKLAKRKKSLLRKLMNQK